MSNAVKVKDPNQHVGLNVAWHQNSPAALEMHQIYYASYFYTECDYCLGNPYPLQKKMALPAWSQQRSLRRLSFGWGGWWARGHRVWWLCHREPSAEEVLLLGTPHCWLGWHSSTGRGRGSQGLAIPRTQQKPSETKWEDLSSSRSSVSMCKKSGKECNDLLHWYVFLQNQIQHKKLGFYNRFFVQGLNSP